MTIDAKVSFHDLSDGELTRLAGLREGAEAAATAHAAFLVLHDRYAPRLIAFLAARRPKRVSVEDLHQTLWLKVWNHLDRFDGLYFSSWIFQIARNLVNQLYRRPEIASIDLSEEELLDGRAETPVRPLIDLEEKQQLADCLRRLSPNERLVVVARLVGDDYDDITAHSAIPNTRAYRLFFEGMAKLKSCVQRAL